MLNLLKLEWLKFKNYRSFRVLLLLYFTLLPLIILLPLSLNISSTFSELSNVTSFYQIPNIFAAAGYLGSWIVFLLMGVLGIQLITMEYEFKTLRQNIISGLSRSQFFFGKLSFIAAIALVLTLYYLFVALAIGFYHTEAIYLSRLTKAIPFLFNYFLQSIAYLITGFLVGLFIKRPGLSVLLYFAYAMFIENIFRYIIHKKILANESMNYYPFNAFEDLVPIPVPKILEKTVETEGYDFIMQNSTAVIVSLLYLALFLFMIYRKIKTSDL